MNSDSNNQQTPKGHLTMRLRTRLRQCAAAAAAALMLATSGLAQAGRSEIIYFHTDANGSPTMAFNADGEICWSETYSPYGEKLDNEDSLPPAEGCGLLSPNDAGYTGHIHDPSGLVYAQQRYYDPQIGRFMSPDPVRPHAGDPRYFGRYHYGANNPYRYTDPTGQWLEDLVIGVPSLAIGVGSFAANVVSGNFAGAVVDAAGIVTDAVAIATPGVPGGAGLGIKAGRELAENAAEVVAKRGGNPKPGAAGGPGQGKNFPQSVQDAERADSGNKCVFCGVDTIRSLKPHPQRSNIDHAIPKSRGGNNTPANAQNTCQTCNLRKGVKTTEEFLNEIH